MEVMKKDLLETCRNRKFNCT